MVLLPPEPSPEALGLARTLGVTTTAANVLLARGYRDAESGGRFLDPRLASLTPPDAMRDRAAAVARIADAVRRRERICVFGDYDADGVTSTALLTDLLRVLGGDVTPLLANRFDGGYGLSDRALDRVLAARPSLLVTCDCGSSDHERLERARAAGVDVVVIDHHRVPDAPLPALAFLNPHHPECRFPYKGLASVGLAFSTGAGVRAALDARVDMRRWLDLVALGTIGDVAPLDGDNRALVRAGLARLTARDARPGVRALAELAGCTTMVPTGEDVAYRFAPRLNAPGRLDKPDLALELLLASNDTDARRIAAEIDALCTRRKDIERAVTAEAVTMLEDPALAALPCVVVARQGWHPGVVGIVAGRLASRFGKPAVVIALDGASGRGSARAPAGFSVYDALAASRDTLIGFGGHHAAAGVEVAADRVDAFRERFANACAAASQGARRDERPADALLADEDRADRVVADLARFEPCGEANPAPRVAVARARVVGAQEVRGGHLRLRVDHRGQPLTCFGPEMGALATRLGAYARLVGSLRMDLWTGGASVEMRLAAAEPA